MLGALRAGLLSTVAFVKQSYADTVIALAPVAYWRLDETGGSTITDQKAVQHGTYFGSIEYGVDPLVRDGLDTSVGFDGSTAYGRIPHNSALASAQGAIAFAFQLDSVSGQHLLIAKEVPFGGAGGLTVDVNNGRLRAFLKDDTGTTVWLPDPDGAADVEVDTAYHVTLTWGGRGAELWLDGVLAASDPSLTIGLGANTHDLLLAAYPGPAALADGVMDEVAFFDRQITADQIQSLARPTTVDHAAPLSQALPTAPPANAYWVDPITGNDINSAAQARSSTTSPSANPWKTLSKAISEWNAGNLSNATDGHKWIVLRGGLSYERGNDLTISRSGSSDSRLKIVGYRNDVEAGTRGGTGKFTGAKGRFVLRGNIQALEGGGWEDDPARGRNIYRSASNFTINGRARGNWLGGGTHNLQLVPARSLTDLDTNNISGNGNSVYSAPGVVGDNNRFYVRLDTNDWTEHFKNDFAAPPTWGINPNSEALAIYDDTVGLQFSATVRFIELRFFNIEYWRRCIGSTNGTTLTDFTMDYMLIKHGFSSLYFQPCARLLRCQWTHCDFVGNIPPWGERVWIHSTPVQAQWDGLALDVGADQVDDLMVAHCRMIRNFDSFTIGRHVSPSNITITQCHFLNNRDDSCAFSVSSNNIIVTYNYWQDCFGACGMYEGPVHQAPRGSFWVGFNVIDLRHYTFVNGHSLTGADRFAKGTAGTTGGMRCGRVEAAHGNNSGFTARKWYHNTILCAKDANSNGGATDVFAWRSPLVDTSNPDEYYNNVIIQIENASVLGRVRSSTSEMDYNCKWFDLAGDTFGGSGVHLRPSNANGTEVPYTSWNAFVSSGSHYNETKHSNGDGPGSPQGWDNHGKFADPEFVNGTWENIVRGDLSTYFPRVNGNLRFAVSLTGSGWPATGSAKPYVGAYQPGDALNTIGPEQGLWID